MAGKRLAPRKMMELAVRIMSESIGEPRSDGKASPVVGAVLVHRNGVVEAAARGELRDGDHAEYTLLERKNRGTKLDDAVLFTTLEPCAPGSRRHPKLSCAERIVLARIKEVWVGIEDPDPTVDRKGIKYLQDSGVTVHLFDRDLQERVVEQNKDFISQAEERAASAREQVPATAPVLSGLESARPLAALGDLSATALEGYRIAAGIAERVGSPAFARRLLLQGLLSEGRDKLVPTGSGVLLFAKEPRVHLPQAGLLGTIHHADGSEETRDFDGPSVLAPEQALQWLRDKLPNPVDRSRAQRRDINATLFELLREGIVNALVHRDYALEGAKCQLVVWPNKIEVRSPGLPVAPITMEQLQAFNAPMLSRNPTLHFVFAKMKLAEERGLGLKSMRTRAAEESLPLPSYSHHAPYVVLTLYRDAQGVLPAEGRTLSQLSAAERAGWDWMVRQEVVTTAAYQRALRLPNRTAKRHLKTLTDRGLLRMVGAGPATRYEVIRSR